MDDLLILIRLALAVTLAIAGVAKLRDIRRFASALKEFGIPALLVKPVGYGLPYVELGIAILLLPSTTAWPAAVAASGLLALFTLAIATHLVQGHRPACNCFGESSTTPIDAMTLVRSATLLACAMLIAISGRHVEAHSVTQWMADLLSRPEVVAVLLLAIIAMLSAGTYLMLEIMRQQGRLMLRMDTLEYRLDNSGAVVPAVNSPLQGLEVGSLAPRFSAERIEGGAASLDAMLQLGLPVILVFSDPECGPCNVMEPRLTKWEQALDTQVTIILVSRGESQQNIARLGLNRPQHMILQADREIAYLYKSFVTPSAVRINAAGLVDSYLALGEAAIDELIHEASSTPILAFASVAPLSHPDRSLMT